ncbi:hypothetical protein BaRGS_00038182 [Batillaria attramentaria]|uniref:Uncharacterized protein n=1 Tax=Batillaria attramentaria TaxID=370345 RepID=A0ABD0J6L3_9CAEN
MHQNCGSGAGEECRRQHCQTSQPAGKQTEWHPQLLWLALGLANETTWALNSLLEAVFLLRLVQKYDMCPLVAYEVLSGGPMDTLNQNIKEF